MKVIHRVCEAIREMRRMEIIRIVIDGREFYVTKECWHLYLKDAKNDRAAMKDLLEKAEAIASEDAKQVRIITKYVN